MKSNLLHKLWNSFLTGLILSAPALITIIVFVYIFRLLDGVLGGFFELWLGVKIPGLGLIALILLILSVGILARMYLGKKLLEWTDTVFANLPVAKTVYLTAKQVQQLFQKRKNLTFYKPVLVKFSEQANVIAFLMHSETVTLGGFEYNLVFFPTTPNPTTGFLFLVEKDKLQPAGNMTSEQALKMIISLGFVTPQQNSSLDEKETNEKQN